MKNQVGMKRQATVMAGTLVVGAIALGTAMAGADLSEAPKAPPQSPAPVPIELDVPVPDTATGILEQVRATAPQELAATAAATERGAMEFDYRPGAAPVIAQGGPVAKANREAAQSVPGMPAAVYAERLTPEQRDLYLGRIATTSQPVEVDGCGGCEVGIIDARPGYVQYLIVSGDAFVNIVSARPEAWPTIEEWALEVASTLSG